MLPTQIFLIEHSHRRTNWILEKKPSNSVLQYLNPFPYLPEVHLKDSPRCIFIKVELSIRSLNGNGCLF